MSRVHGDLENITCQEWLKNICSYFIIKRLKKKKAESVQICEKVKPEANPGANRKGVADFPSSLCIEQELIILDNIRKGEDQTLGKLCSDKQLNVD